eukprot:gb/GEZN01003571.1/.p1 GENE.gb/GEZN01003571.1/~~gb/GEZN01003571.1/.p1  ORF type:complete len:365 (+),score=27.13 gb/GEZN01003571.1/:523-1617(+)
MKGSRLIRSEAELLDLKELLQANSLESYTQLPPRGVAVAVRETSNSSERCYGRREVTLLDMSEGIPSTQQRRNSWSNSNSSIRVSTEDSLRPATKMTRQRSLSCSNLSCPEQSIPRQQSNSASKHAPEEDNDMPYLRAVASIPKNLCREEIDSEAEHKLRVVKSKQNLHLEDFDGDDSISSLFGDSSGEEVLNYIGPPCSFPPTISASEFTQQLKDQGKRLFICSQRLRDFCDAVIPGAEAVGPPCSHGFCNSNQSFFVKEAQAVGLLVVGVGLANPGIIVNLDRHLFMAQGIRFSPLLSLRRLRRTENVLLGEFQEMLASRKTLHSVLDDTTFKSVEDLNGLSFRYQPSFDPSVTSARRLQAN